MPNKAILIYQKCQRQCSERRKFECDTPAGKRMAKWKKIPKLQHEFSGSYDEITSLQLSGTVQPLLHIAFK